MKQLFILCFFLCLFLTVGMTCQQSAPHYETSFGEHEHARTIDLTPGQVRYFRFEPDLYPDSPYYTSFTFEACSGLIQVYASSCSKSGVSCDNGNALWFPNSNSSEFMLDSVYQDSNGAYGQPALSIPKSRSHRMVYYFGVVAKKGDLTNEVNSNSIQVQVSFLRFTKEQGGPYGSYLADNLSIKTSSANKLIQFNALKRCDGVDESASTCNVQIPVKTGYQFTFVKMEDARSGVFNVGTYCGLQKVSNSNSSFAVVPTELLFDQFVNGQQYVLNIGYSNRTFSATSLDVAYEAITWLHNSGGKGDVVDPGKGDTPGDKKKNMSVIIAMLVIGAIVVLIFLSLLIVFVCIKRGSDNKSQVYQRMNGNEPLHPYGNDTPYRAPHPVELASPSPNYAPPQPQTYATPYSMPSTLPQ